jgi:hypothetical protein
LTIERGALLWSPGLAVCFAIIWASVVFTLTLAFDWRTGRNGAAMAVGINLAMVGLFAWMRSH